MSKKIAIISGGELDEAFILSVLEKMSADYVIGVDRGMEFLYRHDIMPDYIVGEDRKASCRERVCLYV